MDGMTPTTSISDLLLNNPIVGERRTGTKRAWTTREIATLRQIYPTQGLKACLAALPGRSAGAIYQRARIEGVTAPERERQVGGGHRKRASWAHSEYIDKAIREGYAAATRRGDIKRLADRVGRPYYYVKQRAQTLGVVTRSFKEPVWSEPELAMIREKAHLNPRTLAKMLAKAGYRRTPVAIIVKQKRIGIEREDRLDPDHYNARQLAQLLGCHDTTVAGWCRRGLLQASPKGTNRTEGQQGDIWSISRKAVRRFIVENTSQVDIRKVDKFWFVDLLAGPYAGDKG
jgi:hypothetical protein